jgi:hypothetical protein
MVPESETAALPSGPVAPADSLTRRVGRYRRQAARCERLAKRVERRIAMLSTVRLVAFAVAALFGWAAWYDDLPLIYGPVAAAGLVAFLVAVYLHRTPHERLPRVTALVRLHREAAARLTGDWDALPDDGARYLDAGVPHLGELQVFGRGSLYQLVCRASLPWARDRLAARLHTPLSPEAVMEAQSAARELSRTAAFCRRLHAEGRIVELVSRHLTDFVGWAETPPGADDAFARTCRRIAFVSVPVTWACIVASASFGLAAPWRIALGLQLLFHLATTGRLGRLYAHLVDRDEARPFVGLRRMFLRVEGRRFQAPRLKTLCEALVSRGERPSARLTALETITDSLAVRFNPLSALLANGLFLWEAFWVGRLADWRARHGSHVRLDLETLAELEVLASVGGFAADTLDAGYCWPALTPDAHPVFAGTGLGHPLIPPARRRTNDFSLGEGGRLVLVTGSNMAGKSSFLRTVGVNALLAQAGAPVCATALTLVPCRLSTSIQITDAPEQGLSRFYAEVKRIRSILDACAAAEATADRPPRLYLVDEMLSGTNSRERNVASLSVARQLLSHRRSFGLVTTHDLSLVALESRFPERVTTCHFTDRFDGEALHFDYRLRPGVATTTNALDVLRLEGIEVDPDATESP